MRKQKRESFLVISMILFNDNNNIHSKEKKRTMIQKRIKYIHEKKTYVVLHWVQMSPAEI